MDSYRVEKQAMQKIMLPDEDAEVGPVPTSGGGHRPEPELDRLSNILRRSMSTSGTFPGTTPTACTSSSPRPSRRGLPRTALSRTPSAISDKENARIEHDKALQRVMTSLMKDDTELFKQFMDNDSFKRWLTDTVFGLAYDRAGAALDT